MAAAIVVQLLFLYVLELEAGFSYFSYNGRIVCLRIAIGQVRRQTENQKGVCVAPADLQLRGQFPLCQPNVIQLREKASFGNANQ